MLLPVPSNRQKAAYRLNRSTAATPPGLGGSAMPGSAGGVVTNGTTYREIVATAGSAKIRARILTVTATGTLNIKPVAPQGASAIDESVMAAGGNIDTTKVTAYSTGTGTAAVAAATEQKVDLDLYGENYVMIEFVCSATGTITWLDVNQV